MLSAYWLIKCFVVAYVICYFLKWSVALRTPRLFLDTLLKQWSVLVDDATVIQQRNHCRLGFFDLFGDTSTTYYFIRLFLGVGENRQAFLNWACGSSAGEFSETVEDQMHYDAAVLLLLRLIHRRRPMSGDTTRYNSFWVTMNDYQEFIPTVMKNTLFTEVETGSGTSLCVRRFCDMPWSEEWSLAFAMPDYHSWHMPFKQAPATVQSILAPWEMVARQYGEEFGLIEGNAEVCVSVLDDWFAVLHMSSIVQNGVVSSSGGAVRVG